MTTNGENQAPIPAAGSAGESRGGIIGATALAVIIMIALLDAVVETVWGGSPIRWWIAPPVVFFIAVVLWLWRPGGALLRRVGPASAAATLTGGMLALLTVTAWLPGGQTEGVRMLGQPTPVVLAGAMAALVALATYVIIRGAGFLPAMPRLIVQLAFALLGLYALASFGLAVKDHLDFVALFQGGALWQRLPRWLQGSFVGALVLLPVAILAQLGRLVGTLRRKQPVRLLVHQTVALVMALVMAISGVNSPGGMLTFTGSYPPGEAVPDRQRVPKPVAQERVDGLFAALETAERAIPADTFDPRAIVAKVGNDPSTLFEWVRDNTFWVPYRGALRGPVGVLMDRLGNSLDRSLLLAELLRVAGHTVQLAHAVLPAQQAATLLAGMKAVPAQPLPREAGLSPEQAGEAAATFAQESRIASANVGTDVRRAMLNSQKLAEDLTERVSSQVPFLAEAVGKPTAADNRERKAVAAIADHWWVQVQDGARWIALDTQAGSAQQTVLNATAEQTYRVGKTGPQIDLASEFCHEVVIRAVIEQWAAGRLTEKTALTYRFRPAEVVGQSIALAHLPIDGPRDAKFLRDQDTVAAMKSGFLEQTEWLPYLSVGGRSLFESSFTATGEINRNPKFGAPRDSVSAAA